MACTLETTVGGEDANSYCSIADGDAYHETHPYATDWEDADTDQKCRTLQTATRLLDSWYDWIGSTASSDQRLLWPRVGAVGPSGYLLASDEIPEAVEFATAELARQLLVADRTADNDTAAKGLTSLTAGSVSMEFKAVSSKPIPDAVMALLSAYGTLRTRSGKGAIRVSRG